MWEQFSRTEMLLGSQAMQALAAAHVAVFGVGGVGGYVVEALWKLLYPANGKLQELSCLKKLLIQMISKCWRI